MRRRVGVRRVVFSALVASLAVFPLLGVSQKPQQQWYHKSPHEHHPPVEHPTRSEQSEDHRDGSHLESKDYNHLKEIALHHQRADAIATTGAPAGIDHTVRAPQLHRGSGKYAGISTPHSARSLQDWEVEDFVLLATVDGSIHARDRKTGAARWKLELDTPMVQTTYYPHNQSTGDHFKPEYEFLWIVEPSRDGEIYIYNQLGNEIQKLHMTVKQLVEDMSPHESIDPAVVYNAEKKTKLYTVDAATGRITKAFGSGGSFGKAHQSCPKTSGFENLDEEECGPGASFVLGRTEYTINIDNRDTTEPICKLVYSEWGPNTRDEDLHSQYSTTMDQKYIYSLHDGSIFGLDYTQINERQRSYTQKLSSPVVRVFDVARPLHVDKRDPQFIVLQQPIGPIDTEYRYSEFNDRNRIFVNRTEAGGWFAMSENTYPLVTGRAQIAQCYDKNWIESISSVKPLSVSQRQDAYIGVHDISDFEIWRGSGLALPAPSPAEVNENPPPSAHAESPSLPGMGRSRIIESAATNAADLLLATIFLILITFLLYNRQILGTILKRKLDLKNVLPSMDQSFASVPATPVVVKAPWSEEPLAVKLNQETEELEEKLEISPIISKEYTLLEPPPDPLRSRADSLEENRGRSESSLGLRFAEHSPPPEEGGAPSSPQPGKKKARRGVRGGVKHKKKRSNSKHEGQSIEQTVQDVMQIARDPPIEPESSRLNDISTTDVTDVSGSVIQIGHLKVFTDTVLGFGSHGTMVYRGSFGGRDVAVKRMLLEFFEIASHEVSLLQESDDHPNVIRYFDKESAGDFLYIALELCPASLQDVVEKPFNYLPLIGSNNLDMPDALKQITAGLQHLHSLKIVHRDIKPQNILVSAPKTALITPAISQPPRLLISDFGLCKKLEGDQNSFRATTAHAAGTSGWRAPELLVDEDQVTPILQTSNNHTGGSTSEPAVVDPQTNRRATRAIDIFSLGCVFYYVLTNGNHPFDKDGKYMREANIVKGFYNIDDLQSLGDYQWEAKDLISSMIAKDPHYRPDAVTVLHHPFFWPAEDRLDFLCQVSDSFEFEPRDPPSPALTCLESYAPQILAEAGGDFLRALSREFRDTLGKQRKYNGERILDLLRALRNKKNHYEDMPEAIKEKVGGLPAGYLGFWSRRFPSLLMVCHRVVTQVGWEGKDRFKRFYGVL